jgi:hypothetical protein
MKVAIAYLTKDRVELTKQTFPVLRDGQHALYWCDGSAEAEARDYFAEFKGICTGAWPGAGFDAFNCMLPPYSTPPELADSWRAAPGKRIYTRFAFPDVRGGADAAIVFALTQMLANTSYTHVGLCENDVLLSPDWFERTLGLFDRGAVDGLDVGAASARAYDDRILVQRDGYAVMFNLGAGHVIFSRRAAELVLEHYRTGWWQDTRALFAQLSGIDIGRYACFRNNQQWCTADWNFDAILAQHGLASLALTPCAAEMIGQEPSLEEQGLALVDREVDQLRNENAFLMFKWSTENIRNGLWKPQAITRIHRASGNGGASLIFPHQLTHPGWKGDWRLKWAQGFGPFAWRANADGALLHQMIFGPCTFLVSGGKRSAKITLRDCESGYEIEPEVPPAEHGITQLTVPGTVSYRGVEMVCGEGAVFYGIMTAEPQPEGNQKFDYSVLPPV